jgi:hypothetical protein
MRSMNRLVGRCYPTYYSRGEYGDFLRSLPRKPSSDGIQLDEEAARFSPYWPTWLREAHGSLGKLRFVRDARELVVAAGRVKGGAEGEERGAGWLEALRVDGLHPDPRELGGNGLLHGWEVRGEPGLQSRIGIGRARS